MLRPMLLFRTTRRLAPRLTRGAQTVANADDVIAALKTNPGLIDEVLRKADGDVRRQLLSSTEGAAFEEADADGDGRITRDEFKVWHLRRFPVTPATEQPEAAVAPTGQQLRRLALKIGVPFVGFGFLDNAIMITAGDQIDAVFGAALGLSAMASAGLGNLVSDVVGIQAGNSIESAATRAGMPEPALSPAQLGTTSARVVAAAASMVGISIGCVLGLAPLLLMEDEETRRLRAAFAEVDVDGSGSVSFGELEDRVHKLGLDIDRRHLEQIFHEIDADRSRCLSFEEFRELAKRWQGPLAPRLP